MKVTILTGPGETSKAAVLLKIKQQFKNDTVLEINLKQQTESELREALGAVPLFGTGSRLVIADNATSKLDLTNFNQPDDNLSLVVVTAKLEAASVLAKTAKLLNHQILTFEAEKELTAFPFIDCLLDQNQAALMELEKLLDHYGGMYVLTMIYYGLRRNLLPAPASEFVRKKVQSQKKNFQDGDWELLYRQSLETEFMIKNGLMPERLAMNRLTLNLVNFGPK